jgi:large subunit ribosomal protein L6
MSKIGRQPVQIPDGATVTVASGKVTVKGPLATFTRDIPECIKVTVADNIVTVAIDEAKPHDKAKAFWGTTRALIAADLEGATKGYTKVLEIEGVGYNMKVQGDKLILAIGFSHPVEVMIPKGIKCEVKKNITTITGVSKHEVGQFAANIRALKKPEPYLGKGIRYQDEHVRRKEGKKAEAAGTGA